MDDGISRGDGERWKTHILCRACHLACSLVAEMEGDEPVKFYGDKNNPISFGFSCVRGREIGNYGLLPSRLKTSMKRDAVGGFGAISSEAAAREVADQLRGIVELHGPRAVAVYAGGYCVMNTLTNTFTIALMEAIGSPMYFTPEPIDQPGKPLANALHGRWLGGTLRGIDGFDAMLLFGSNPLVSGGGPFGNAVGHNMNEAKKTGTKLIVCDPRRSETARKADIHLQVRPGEDVAVIAGMIRLILREGLYDSAFVEAEAQGLERLRAAVEPYTPEYVAARADIAADELISAARIYAGARRGLVHFGTGPNMSGRGTLCEYLGRVLTTLCGHWPRAGDYLQNPGVLVKFPDPVAATPGPTPVTGFGEKMRVHGLTQSASGLPTSVLPDEILLPGEGQVKALLVIGGNPMVSFPDQEKTLAALKSLELLVTLDPHMSGTARLSHYVIAPKAFTEAAGVAGFWEQAIAAGTIYGFDLPYQQYSPPLVAPPDGADVVEEWEFLYRVAQHMKLQMTIRSGATIMCAPEEAEASVTKLDMNETLSSYQAWEAVFRGSPVPFAEVSEKGRGGHVFDIPPKRIAEKPANWEGRFEIGSEPMMAELHDVVHNGPVAEESSRPFSLISRRLSEIFNSNWHEHEALRRRWRYNPAFMNPDDIEKGGFSVGEVVRIESDRASILGVIEPDPDVKSGCISMAHGWGPNPDEPEDPKRLGSTTSRLCDNTKDVDRYAWIPRMSAIPVSAYKIAS